MYNQLRPPYCGAQCGLIPGSSQYTDRTTSQQVRLNKTYFDFNFISQKAAPTVMYKKQSVIK